MQTIIIRIEPRGTTQQIEIEDGAEPPAEIPLDNGLIAIYRGVDDEGVHIYDESVVVPKPGPVA